MIRANSIELKKINRNNIYKLICNSEKISKGDISKILNISIPTVAQNLNELMDNGLIEENGDFESTGGRKAKAITAIYNFKVSIGIDITKNHLSAILVDLKGDIIDSFRERTPFNDSNEYYKEIGAVIEKIINKNKIDAKKVLGVGVTIPAIISEDKKMVDYVSLVNIPKDFYLKIMKEIPFPCALFNDSNAGGFAEQWKRNNKENIVYLSLSNSVGGAIISNQRIFYGENQRGGEFGHMTIHPDGKECYCGKKGCLDAYCASHLLSDHTDGKLSEFFKLVDLNQKKYVDIWNKYLENLSIAVHNIRMCFDCDIVIGGYIGKYIAPRLDQLKELLKQRNMFETEVDFVKPCNYSIEETAVGGALYYVNQFINSV